MGWSLGSGFFLGTGSAMTGPVGEKGDSDDWTLKLMLSGLD